MDMWRQLLYISKLTTTAITDGANELMYCPTHYRLVLQHSLKPLL